MNGLLSMVHTYSPASTQLLSAEAVGWSTGHIQSCESQVRQSCANDRPLNAQLRAHDLLGGGTQVAIRPIGIKNVPMIRQVPFCPLNSLRRNVRKRGILLIFLKLCAPVSYAVFREDKLFKYPVRS